MIEPQISIERTETQIIFNLFNDLKNKDRKTQLIFQYYFKFIRKILYIFFLLLTVLVVGQSIETSREIYNWTFFRIMELIFFSLMFLDFFLIHYCIVKLKGLFVNILLSSYLLIVLFLFSIKIWGPDLTQINIILSTNCLRVILSILLIYFFNEKQFLRNFNFCYKNNHRENIDRNNINLKINNNFKETKEDRIIRASILKSSKKNSIIKNSSQRNSVEKIEGKIIEEINCCIKQKIGKNSKVLNIQLFNVLNSNLDSILDDDFNIFKFSDETLRNPLYTLMNYYYLSYNFESLKVPEYKYLNLIYNIQKNYNENPYHNSVHAADVSNTLHYLITKKRIESICNYSKLEIFILLISGAIHDVNHPGHNNIFEINSGSILAVTYNDKSVLENYHLFVFFNLISNQYLNIFENFEIMELKNIRKLLITNVISTDMTNHKTEVRKMQEILTSQNLDFKNKETKEYIMTHLLHFSDISNPTKTFNVYKECVDKLFTEFFLQGDKEKNLNLPISFNCDRNSTNIPKGQVFFIDFFVKEELNLIISICPEASNLLDILEENRKKYDEIKETPYILK